MHRFFSCKKGDFIVHKENSILKKGIFKFSKNDCIREHKLILNIFLLSLLTSAFLNQNRFFLELFC